MRNFFLDKILLPLGDMILGGNFIQKLHQWRRITRLPKTELQKIQKEKLAEILKHASLNVPFYTSLKVAEDADPYVWLSKFPILKKIKYKESIDLFRRQDLAEDRLTAIMSSGSTGPPSQVFFSAGEIGNNRALQILWWEWAGYRFGNSVLQTGVNMNRSKEKAFKDWLLSTRYISAMSHSEGEILKELKLLESQPRDHFVAYASSVYLFAKTAKEHGINTIKFKSVISLGEKLLPQFRETIESTFSCKVFDTYGASEGFLIASQCEFGNYHIMSPHVYVEIVDDDGQEVEAGETGRILITGLDNYTTPLIRYELGDMVVKGSHAACHCGLELPTLNGVIGRLTEFLITPKGKYITVQNVVRIMKHFPSVEQFKLIQKKQHEFEVLYVKSTDAAGVDELAIKEMFEDTFEEPLSISFATVNQLPKAKSGKFQLIENHI